MLHKASLDHFNCILFICTFTKKLETVVQVVFLLSFNYKAAKALAQHEEVMKKKHMSARLSLVFFHRHTVYHHTCITGVTDEPRHRTRYHRAHISQQQYLTNFKIIMCTLGLKREVFESHIDQNYNSQALNFHSQVFLYLISCIHTLVL